jgi:nicotinamidase-related amidase
MSNDETWVVVVDMQEVFADPASAWCAPGAAALVPTIAAVARHHGGRVVLTRFVAPAEPSGSWVDYYEAWPFALRPPEDPLWSLVPGLPTGPVVDATTFSKWGPALLEATGGSRHLVVCGVATDCCVLMTALAAADDGATVRVVGDACAAGDGPAHTRALQLLDVYDPMIRVTTAAEELAGSTGGRRG